MSLAEDLEYNPKDFVDFVYDEKYHTTKDGRVIAIKDLTDSHLTNILRWLEKKAKKGVLVISGGGTCAEDVWADSEILYGDKALEYLNYKSYLKEFNKRKLKK